MPDLLIELFSEEIPARMQARAAEDLKKRITDGLVEAGLTYAGAAAFHTPRRLTLALSGLLAESPTLREERKGPRTDAPEKAIEGFLRGAGVTRDQLQEGDDKKGAVFFAVIEKPGRPAAEIVAEVLDTTIRNFPWPKSMRWGTGSLRWVRPLHSILCILTDEAGAEVVPLDIDGIKTTNTTEGHRFMAPGRFAVSSFDAYVSELKRRFVILDATERADHIWQDATNQAFANGLEVVEDRGLLAEVAGLVEWPVVLMGEIGADFLGLPPEVLQTSMKEHQKFFSVRNPKTGRIERFITVANRETRDQGVTILAGNQKVLAARLSDAKFFWENDLRVAKHDGMEAWTAALSNVTFHNKLGSQAERIERIAALAREIAPALGADPDLAEKAARVAKADLSSEMVYEFPELQGLMGRYYAEAAGLPAEVAAACQEHYSPLGPTDDVPTAPVSATVALADKLDTLTGFWAIDEKPTGSKDPFALRRAALGVIRLLLANDVRGGLVHLIGRALRSILAAQHLIAQAKFEQELAAADQTYAKIMQTDIATIEELMIELDNMVLEAQTNTPDVGNSSTQLSTDGDKELKHLPNVATDLLAFFHDRLKVHLKDEGIRHDVIDACLAMPGNDDITLLVKRARALSDALKTDDGVNLVQGFKRANNILTQAEEKDGVAYEFGADIKFAEAEEEKTLFTALQAAEPKIAAALEAEDFAAAMAAMAALRGPIDAFFTAVQVNSDNDVVRRNRLNLLSTIRTTVLKVADLTRIEG
ncbi:glycine--tRNA ligase subunit beta [Pseudooceanicola sediminis]|uniref:Glycine--tRNA ligase beta subunit n=1 Tax=Pseudooceanicola sediminis TaxID=2211117 RepID=A0A399IZ77_9RHOB|nr:glycine--tRNA ligase subunit beta [Pseudooceanicola sediminis]KAA2313109.1 glycine--tRNA ligase subunit beta [Puniceibacterium sp. HSS470]RII37757.1 glycine--tRNA ligase subunit beta [Pseudooceanicola sediminis]|tara:strand:+ start:47176 stop:49461 length:2286 start_codon:yes stop_codon:yes gene_type:complete